MRNAKNQTSPRNTRKKEEKKKEERNHGERGYSWIHVHATTVQKEERRSVFESGGGGDTRNSAGSKTERGKGVDGFYVTAAA